VGELPAWTKRIGLEMFSSIPQTLYRMRDGSKPSQKKVVQFKQEETEATEKTTGPVCPL
jgi:hypothetical protein